MDLGTNSLKMDLGTFKIMQQRLALEMERSKKRLRAEGASEEDCQKGLDDAIDQFIMEVLQQSIPGVPAPDLTRSNFSSEEYIERCLDLLQVDTSAHDGILQTVQKKSPALASQIFDAWEKLKKIMAVHSDTLQRRWLKRTVDKRKKLLLEAWPGMCPGHRPDFDALRRQLKGPKHRDAWLMPYINLEDLSSPKYLLCFLESRIKEGPEYFAWSDSAPYQMAKAMKALEVPNASRHTMLLSGQKTRATYGSLVAWNDDPSLVEDVYLGFGFTLGEGLHLLETQKRLYLFLLRCTELLLQDTDLSTSTLDDLAVYSQHGKLMEDSITLPDPTEWRSISEMNAEAAYRLPQQFALDSLRKLAAAKRDEAEDAFWALREDPTYFQEELKERYRQEMEPLRKLSRDSGFRIPPGTEESALQNTCRNLVHNACRNIILWDTVSAGLVELEKIRARLATEIRPLKRLPPVYKEAMARFSIIEKMVSDYASRDLRFAITSSPEFLKYYDIQLEGSLVRLEESIKDEMPPILKLLNDLDDKKTASIMGALNILDEVERMMNSGPSQRAMITAGMARQISEMATFAQLQDALNQHQPKIQVSENHDAAVDSVKARLGLIEVLGKHVKSMVLATHVKPDSAFEYPISRKNTQQNVEKMRGAEAKLDAFWEHIDKHLMNRTGKTLQKWMGNRLTAREVQRTQPWQPREEPRPKKPETTAVGSSTETYYFRSDIAPETLEKLQTEPKLKSKTRGQADPSRKTFDSEPAEASQDAETPVQTFVLPSRPFKTMSTLFPASNQDRTAGKVMWKDFLHAMYRLDFLIQKRHGSEWYFEPIWKRDAPITIHEPHPSNETRFAKLRFEANRLTRKYGWDSETFQPI